MFFRQSLPGLAVLASQLVSVNAAAIQTVYEIVSACPTVGPGAPVTVTVTSPANSAASGGSANNNVANAAVAVASTTTSSYAAHETTLLPAIHWDNDLTDITNLAPQDSSALYYAETYGVQDMSAETQFAHVLSNFTYPTVILEHTSYIESLTCSASASNASNTDMSIIFNSTTAYEYAKGQWSNSTDLVLVSFTAGCGEAGSQQHTFWLVDTLVWTDGSTSCIATSSEILIEDSVTDLDISWGTYSPSGSSSAAGTSTSGTGSSTGTGSGSSSSSNSPGSGSSSSGTATTSNNSTCGSPSSSTISGFPAAACGSNFDQTLDDAIGYLDFSSADYSTSLEDFVPGLGDYSEADADEPMRRRYASMQKRGVWNWIKSGVTKVKNVIVDKGSQAVGNIVSGVQAGFHAAVNLAADLTSYNPTLSKTLNADLAPTDLVASPFGQAKSLYSYSKTSSNGAASGSFDVYCVDCGFHATLTLAGQASLNVVDGLKSGSVSLTGSAHAGLFVGLDAQVQYNQKFTKQIANIGLPGFSIPKIITVGPVVTVGTELDINAQATGQLLVGVAMDLPNFQATLDIVDSTKSGSSGFTPVFTKNFTASGEIDITIGFGLPVSVGVGLVAPIIKFDKTIALIEKPGIQANAKYVGSTDANSAALAASSCPNGISYSLGLTNDVSLDFFGLKSVDLFPYTAPPLAAGCYPLGSSSGSSSSSSTVSSTTTSMDDSETTSSTTSEATPTTTDSGDDNGDATTTTTSATPTTTADDSDETQATTTTTSSASDPTDDGTDNTATTTTTSATTDPTDDATTNETTTTSETGTESPANGKRWLQKRQSNDTSTDDAGTIADDNFDDEDSSPDDSDYQALQTEADDDASGQDDSTTEDDSYSYITIADTTSTYQLNAYDDGNFYLDSFGAADPTYFSTYEGVTVSDDSNRFFHYYQDTMTTYGVSRFRLSDESAIPKTANAATMAPLDTGSGTVFVVVDLVDGFYYPVACAIEGQYTKLFLVKDIDAGIKTLQDPSLMYTVTGGVVSSCSYIPLMAVSTTT